jgi:hypothetical protein
VFFRGWGWLIGFLCFGGAGLLCQNVIWGAVMAMVLGVGVWGLALQSLLRLIEY